MRRLILLAAFVLAVMLIAAVPVIAAQRANLEASLTGEMPSNKELLRSLREGFKQLDPFDRSNLNSLRNCGQMLIRRVFGGNGLYKDQVLAE